MSFYVLELYLDSKDCQSLGRAYLRFAQDKNFNRTSLRQMCAKKNIPKTLKRCSFHWLELCFLFCHKDDQCMCEISLLALNIKFLILKSISCLLLEPADLNIYF